MQKWQLGHTRQFKLILLLEGSLAPGWQDTYIRIFLDDFQYLIRHVRPLIGFSKQHLITVPLATDLILYLIWYTD